MTEAKADMVRGAAVAVLGAGNISVAQYLDLANAFATLAVTVLGGISVVIGIVYMIWKWRKDIRRHNMRNRRAEDRI